MCPYYEFLCPVCGLFEKKMKMKYSDLKALECNCGETAAKIPSKTTFELKGGGWYASGYTKGD